MSGAVALLADNPSVHRNGSDAFRARDDARQRASFVAWLGACALVLAAPFETLQPVLRLPGQSLSSVETVLIVVFLAWLTASVSGGVWPRWQTPVTRPWLAFALASLMAALAAPEQDRGNAVHMAGRIAAAFGVFLLTINGVASRERLRTLMAVAAAAGVIVSLLVFLEYLGVAPILAWLRQFRVNVAHVGAQIRAGGPFQYPTIASMYLEIVFALTLGLLLAALDGGKRALAAVFAIVLAAISQAITLTFTRSGLIACAATLVIVVALRVGQRGVDRGAWSLAAVALVIGLQVVTSRSLESLRLRMTTEGQNTWYSARIDAPARLSLRTGTTSYVPVTLTNTGHSSWDPHSPNPIRLSYHWLLPNADRIVSWEGARTDLTSVVRAGDQVTVQAEVVALRHAGEFRLMWDIEQEHRLWFSTEPEAELFVSTATISGASDGSFDRSRLASLPALPTRAVRPGRLVLWGAAGRMLAEHPFLGVGPDNFRLNYGRYAGLAGADPRVHSNNMYIEVLAGGGIVAGAAFLWLLWSVTLQTLRLVQSPHVLTFGVAAAAAAIALHGLADSFLSFSGTYILMALTLGLVTAAVNVEETAESHAHRV